MIPFFTTKTQYGVLTSFIQFEFLKTLNDEKLHDIAIRFLIDADILIFQPIRIRLHYPDIIAKQYNS